MRLLGMMLRLLGVHPVLLRRRGRVQSRLRLQLGIVYHPGRRCMLHPRGRRGIGMLRIMLLR